MKTVPFEKLEKAKENDAEAAEWIRAFFGGYIADRSLKSYTDSDGKETSYVDEDLRYLGERALLSAIFKFQFRNPPDDFNP